jgi:hypothetical protein
MRRNIGEKNSRDWGEALKQATKETTPHFKKKKSHHASHAPPEPEIPKGDTAELDLVFGNELTEFVNQAKHNFSRANFEHMLSDLFITIETKASDIMQQSDKFILPRAQHFTHSKLRELNKHFLSCCQKLDHIYLHLYQIRKPRGIL